MKKTETILLLIMACGQLLYSQNNLPLIKANSVNAIIIEGDEKSDWWIDPAIKPDVHVIAKSPKPKWVTFRTDVDSIKTKISPGQKFDFIVLLDGKDSCFTRIQSEPIITKFAKQTPASHDTIPFVLTEFNNIKIQAVLNQRDTLFLKFDSGATGLLLTREAIVKKTSLLPKRTGGDSEAPTKPDFGKMNRYNTLKLGNLTWDSLRIRPVELSGHGTDGRFGWDFFDGRVVEIDFDRSLFIVHSSIPKIGKGYSKLPIEYCQGLFCINGILENRGKKHKNRFLFDNGYQRTIMLDSTLMAQQHYPQDLKILKKTIMKTGQGIGIPVITVNNEILKIGKTALPNIPAQKLNSANPAGFTVHILGNEVLKRFNTILDFYGNKVYLKPNKLLHMPYADAS